MVILNSNDGLGTLRVRLALDEPGRVHYGCDDPIYGTVRVRHTPNFQTGTELFGPLELDVTLTGTTLVTMGHNDIGRIDPKTICSESRRVHRGPFRFEADTDHEFRFSISFPEHALPKTKTAVEAVQGGDGLWRFHQTISRGDIEQLPPTCHSLDWQSITRKEISVQYDLTVNARMPGIDVAIMEPMRAQTVLYEQPRVPADAAAAQSQQINAFSQSLTTQGTHLLSEQEKPQGFRGKLKAKFDQAELPKYTFTLDCMSFPKHLFVGQPVKFDVTLVSNNLQSTASVIPEITIDSCNLSLISFTKGTTSDFSHKEVANMTTIKSKDADIIPPGPFTAAHNYTKTIDVGVLGSVPSTFAQSELGRDYKMRLELHLSTMGQTMRITRRQLAVFVHPPVLDESAAPPDDVEAYMRPPPEDGEQLPSYNEAVAEPASG